MTADERGHVDAELEPPGTPDECIDALKATASTYWDEAPEGPSWQRTVDGPTFLHPDMDWATLSAHEAPVLPRFAEGDEVRIVSSTKYPDLVGATATIYVPCYSYSDECWLYTLHAPTWRGPRQFTEAELTTPPAAPPARWPGPPGTRW
ncbi:hypothetical protein GCM10029964_101820 [Kibdelosporangium lantanae]